MTNRRGVDTLVPEVKVRLDGQEMSFEAISDVVSVEVVEDVYAAG